MGTETSPHRALGNRNWKWDDLYMTDLQLKCIFLMCCLSEHANHLVIGISLLATQQATDTKGHMHYKQQTLLTISGQQRC